MAKPLEQHLKTIIGDLVIQVAQLSAENEALREQLPKPDAPKTK